MIKFLGNEYLEFLPMFEEIKEEHKNSKYKVLVIDWWHYKKDDPLVNVTRGEGITLEIITKVKEYDICFFMISEIWFCPQWDISSEAINAMIEELDKLNVFYISLSEDSLIHINESKSYDTPWFIPNGSNFHVGDTFKLDFDYRPKDFTFNMLLGSDRHYRTLFFELLGNEQYIYSTYFGHKKFRLESSNHLEDDDILNNLSNQDIFSEKLQTMEHVKRADDHFCISHIIPEKIYNNSHFDIVTESQALFNTLNFTTEKTGKPLSTGRFFIWYDSPHKVEYLRKFGFELQDYVLCDYDSIEDNVDRLALVLELIKEIGDNENYIKKIYKDTKDARIHNQEVFRELSRTSQSDISSWINGQINKAS